MGFIFLNINIMNLCAKLPLFALAAVAEDFLRED